MRGIETWRDGNGPWGQQGVEQAAFAIQQRVIDMPESELSSEQRSRLCGFEILTAGLAASTSGSFCDPES